MKVAVSQRVDPWPDRNERRDALDQRLCQWLLAAGCLAVPVPNAWTNDADRLQAWLQAIAPDGVLLSGGNDIGTMPERDRTENGLLDHAREHALPVLGICRGMQQMAVWAGGLLEPIAGHVCTRHRLRTVAACGPWPDEVNSFHAFGLADGPPGFVVTARTANGSIEAMRHQTLPWEGWMWHPEREPVFQVPELKRLRALFCGDETR